jgi:pimeloyl-ACP methyl ester carboxylesterase
MTIAGAHLLQPGRPGSRTALFVHGVEDDWRTWVPLTRQLDDWRCWAVQMPWHPGNDYRWRWTSTLGGWLAAEADQIGEQPDVLVGHSLGANAVLDLVAADRRRARPMVLVTPFFRPSGEVASWTTFDRSRSVFEEQIAAGLRSRLARRRTGVPAEVVRCMQEKACERIGPTGFLTLFDEYLRSGHLPLSAVIAPALVVSAGQDAGLVHRHLRALVAELPAGVLRHEPDYDHFCHITRAVDLAAAIRDFAEPRTIAAEKGVPA